MDYNSLGGKIRVRRQELKYTQEALAEMAGVTTSFIGQIERAERKLSLETLVAIAGSMRVSVDYLLRDSLPCGEKDPLYAGVAGVFAKQPTGVKMASIELVQALLDDMKAANK